MPRKVLRAHLDGAEKNETLTGVQSWKKPEREREKAWTDLIVAQFQVWFVAQTLLAPPKNRKIAFHCLTKVPKETKSEKERARGREMEAYKCQ